MENHLIQEQEDSLFFHWRTKAARTFSKVVKLSVRSEAHVLLGREAIAVKRFRPRVTLAGQDRSTAVPHRHAETAARLDETARRREEMLQTEDRASGGAAGRGFRRRKTHVSRQTGAMREQRKACA